MPSVTLHTTRAMASAIAKEAIATNSSSRRCGGEMLDRQIKKVLIDSPMASATKKINDQNRQLARRYASTRRVVAKVAADGDENDPRWQGLKNVFAGMQAALDAARMAITSDVGPGAAAIADLHTRAAAAVARTRGPGMTEGHLSDENLKLSRVALATGSVAHPMRTNLNIKP